MKLSASAWARRTQLPLVGIMAMLLVGLTGCATVYRTTPGSLTSIDYKYANDTPLEQVYITTTGYYCLWTVPLFSGDLRWNAEKQSINGGTCLFSDQVGATELQDALLKIAESRNCDVIDIAFHDSDTSYAGVSTGGLIGALFGSSQIGISGVFVPRKDRSRVQQGVVK